MDENPPNRMEEIIEQLNLENRIKVAADPLDLFSRVMLEAKLALSQNGQTMNFHDAVALADHFFKSLSPEQWAQRKPEVMKVLGFQERPELPVMRIFHENEVIAKATKEDVTKAIKKIKADQRTNLEQFTITPGSYQLYGSSNLVIPPNDLNKASGHHFAQEYARVVWLALQLADDPRKRMEDEVDEELIAVVAGDKSWVSFKKSSVEPGPYEDLKSRLKNKYLKKVQDLNLAPGAKPSLELFVTKTTELDTVQYTDIWEFNSMIIEKIKEALVEICPLGKTEIKKHKKTLKAKVVKRFLSTYGPILKRHLKGVKGFFKSLGIATQDKEKDLLRKKTPEAFLAYFADKAIAEME